MATRQRIERLGEILDKVRRHTGASGPRRIETPLTDIYCWQATDDAGEAILLQLTMSPPELRVNIGNSRGTTFAFRHDGELTRSSWGPSSVTMMEILDTVDGAGAELTADDQECLQIIRELTERTGAAPTQYQLRRRLQNLPESVVSHRVARLIRAGMVDGTAQNPRKRLTILHG